MVVLFIIVVGERSSLISLFGGCDFIAWCFELRFMDAAKKDRFLLE